MISELEGCSLLHRAQCMLRPCAAACAMSATCAPAASMLCFVYLPAFRHVPDRSCGSAATHTAVFSAGVLAGGCQCRAIWSPAWVPSMVQALPATLPAPPSILDPSLAALNHQELALPLRWCCRNLAVSALGLEVFSLETWEAGLARAHSCQQAGSLTGAQGPLPAALCHPYRAGRASPPASLAAQGMPSCLGRRGSHSRARGPQGPLLACRAAPVVARGRASSGRAAAVLAVAAPTGSSRDWSD